MRARRLFLVLLSLFLAVAAHAQSESADLKIEFEFAPEEHLTSKGFGTYVRISNDGPSTARGIVITAEAPGASGFEFWQTLTRCDGATCSSSYKDIEPGKYVEFSVAFQLANEVETTIPLTVRVTSATPDPRPENNVVTQNQVFLAVPDLHVTLDTNGSRIDPEMPAEVVFGVRNLGKTAALGTVVELTLPPGSTLLAVKPPTAINCTNDGLTVRCDVGTVFPSGNVSIGVTARTPAMYDGGFAPITVKATAANRILQSRFSSTLGGWTFTQLFVVDNTADSGPGSLRQAIVDANARCGSYCNIGFRIPAAMLDGDAATIRPATLLPPVTASATIDGVSERYFIEQPARDHPVVQLDGSLLSEGDGLRLQGDGSQVSGLAIGNFPGTAIVVARPETQGHPRSIVANFIGTDVTGRIAKPNQRGIMVLGVRYGEIRDNVISGNRLSGIWLLGTFQYSVRKNRIGVAADAVTPLPNGASGIYIGPLNEHTFIQQNTIAYNAQFGIGVHPSVRTLDAASNFIFGNGHLGIDYGLDLATPNVPIDAGRQPNTPVLLSATYNAATNVTTIAGDLHSVPEAPPFGNRVRVLLYANDTAQKGQAQTPIGTVVPDASGHFTYPARGDLRGKFIAGITFRYRLELPGTLEEYQTAEETSEISAPIGVTP